MTIWLEVLAIAACFWTLGYLSGRRALGRLRWRATKRMLAEDIGHAFVEDGRVCFEGRFSRDGTLVEGRVLRGDGS